MTICGKTTCHDDDAYCCFDDAFNNICCVHHIYEKWWFWFTMIAAVMFLGICVEVCSKVYQWNRQHALTILINPSLHTAQWSFILHLPWNPHQLYLWRALLM